jgi:hypothetical protein
MSNVCLAGWSLEMNVGKVLKLHSQAKQAVIWNRPLFMSSGSKLVGPSTARIYELRLPRLWVGS